MHQNISEMSKDSKCALNFSLALVLAELFAILWFYPRPTLPPGVWNWKLTYPNWKLVKGGGE